MNKKMIIGIIAVILVILAVIIIFFKKKMDHLNLEMNLKK